jgi:hypothetical protein
VLTETDKPLGADYFRLAVSVRAAAREATAQENVISDGTVKSANGADAAKAAKTSLSRH